MSVHNEDEDINMDLQNEYGDEDEEEYKYVYSKEFRKTINKFIEEAFDKTGHRDTEHQPTKNNNCKWCPFHKTHLCSATF